MDVTSATTLDDVKSVVVATLGIEDRADSLDASTPLLGSLPELDSMAVVELILALDSRFGIETGDDEITGDVFETLGSLAAFVEHKLAERS
ncbi:MAG: acyl carrier protein [Micromonosporaceae bacterium]